MRNVLCKQTAIRCKQAINFDINVPKIIIYFIIAIIFEMNFIKMIALVSSSIMSIGMEVNNYCNGIRNYGIRYVEIQKLLR